MIPVQYRDPETEEILDRRYEESVPTIGRGCRSVSGITRCSSAGSVCRPVA